MIQYFAKEFAGVGTARRCHLFRRTLRHDLATSVTAFGTKVNYVVGTLNHLQIVLDHQDGVTRISESTKNSQ